MNNLIFKKIPFFSSRKILHGTVRCQQVSFFLNMFILFELPINYIIITTLFVNDITQHANFSTDKPSCEVTCNK